jgi:hypothetical protein
MKTKLNKLQNWLEVNRSESRLISYLINAVIIYCAISSGMSLITALSLPIAIGGTIRFTHYLLSKLHYYLQDKVDKL